MVPSPVFAITGQLAAGKTTLARAVLERFERGFHIDVDAIREMVSPGLASPIEWTDETARQFELAVAGSVALAAVYAEAGYAVAIEGAIDPFAVDRHVDAAGLRERLVGVVLHPPVDVARQRNRERETKAFDTSILDPVIVRLDEDLAREPDPPGWLRIDNGAEDVEATVERLLEATRGLG